jgi:hypothetical protein
MSRGEGALGMLLAELCAVEGVEVLVAADEA